MPAKNIVSWTAMLSVYGQNGLLKKARDLFDKMPQRTVVSRREGEVRVEPTTFTIIFEACGRYCKYELGCQIHGLVLRLGHECDVFLGNSIITMYSRFGYINAARSTFDAMIHKDIISWNSLISCYVQGERLEEAYELFEIEMLRSAVRPNSITLFSMLSASAGLAALNQGLQVHAHVFKMRLEYDLLIQSSLVSMYSKCGSLNDAYRVFKSVREPNIFIFNAMITGFAQNGLGNEALILFKELESEGEKPNGITFIGVLSACAHAGMIEEGWNYFKSMRSLYMIEPELDHYAIMVDILGKAGLLDEAMSLINSMPLEPHSGVWGALLSASRTHLRLDLAKVAAEHISNLEPSNSAPLCCLVRHLLFSGEEGG
nr:pentatricopeptide repeat-containing protein At1g53600, mitochondrial [Ipomoea batatas]